MDLSTSKKSYSYPSHQITRTQIIILTHVHIPLSLSLSTSPLSRVHHFGKKGGDPCRAGWFGEKTEFLHSPPVGTPAVR
jgi:hypothetical protein